MYAFKKPVMIIGGGLAGCEAAWQLIRRGLPVDLYEMKPLVFSPAHQSPLLAELVCSNSLRSNLTDSAAGLLKQEMRLLRSLIMDAAAQASVPAGRALAVDRSAFSRYIENVLGHEKRFRLFRQEVSSIPDDCHVIVATGPLTSPAFAEFIQSLTGSRYLYFYDSISPIVMGDSIDYDAVFRASRYDKNGSDYLNCPLDQHTYEQFNKELLNADVVSKHSFEDARFFEGCLPIEVLARRGMQTLAYGPMKPVGLTDPKTGKPPYAVVQLRQENRDATMFNMVGFQTRLSWTEQKRIFRGIPGLECAEFARYGSIHRNTYINTPALLNKTLQLTSNGNIYFAGQITGVEGYVESAAIGLIAGLSLATIREGKKFVPPPKTTAHGSLVEYISTARTEDFQPMNMNFGLFPPLEGRCPKKEKGMRMAQRALQALNAWSKEVS
jgi:methylenetetrahydrofolate--tRNA-(uracil-5-)-methyltransferase